MIRLLVLVTVVLAALPGADGAPPAMRTAGAGKADAEAVFLRQDGKAGRPTGPGPGIVGSYLWGGRADEQYRPFFQWDLRLRGGSATASDLRLRIATLGPERQILHQGDWKALSPIGPGAISDLDYRLNCPTFAAWQAELSWSDGTASFLAPDKMNLPMATAALADGPYLMAVEARSEAKDRGANHKIDWWIWNVGGQPAIGATQVLHFLDEDGADVKTVPIKEPVDIPANAVVAQTRTLKGLPKHVAIGVSVKVLASATGSAVTVAAGSDGFTGVADLEVGFLRLAKGTLVGRVRNGTGKDLSGVAMTLTLSDRAGKALTTLEIPAGDLAAGADRAFSAPAPGVTTWAGLELGWTSGAPAQSATIAGLVGTVVTSDPLTFTVSATDPDGEALVLRGTIVNGGTDDLAPLRLSFTMRDGNRQEVVEWTCASLPAGASQVLTVRSALGRITSIAMAWAQK